MPDKATTIRVTISKAGYDAVVFDMDGVVTRTASVHAAAWAAMFNAFLAAWSARTGTPQSPFSEQDYLRFVDGKPRLSGVRDFLASRGITLPEGSPDDPPEAETVRGLGDRKNASFLNELREHGVKRFESTVTLVQSLKAAGIHVAVISASRNTTHVLEAAGVRELFEAQVDGEVAASLGLPGKPDPAVFVEAARRLDAIPARSVVVEDAIAGVQAGRAGDFGLVIGVDRGGNAAGLTAAGADVVVGDLAEVAVGA